MNPSRDKMMFWWLIATEAAGSQAILWKWHSYLPAAAPPGHRRRRLNLLCSRHYRGHRDASGSLVCVSDCVANCSFRETCSWATYWCS